MATRRPLLVRAAFVLFGSKVFLFGKTDHAEPGFRHITPHALLRRIFGALGPSAALRGVSAVLVRLAYDAGHQAQPGRNGNEGTVLRYSFLTIIIDSGSLCSPAGIRADPAKEVIEDSSIVRQRHAAEIAVLAIEPPDVKKDIETPCTLCLCLCGTAMVRLQEMQSAAALSSTSDIGAAPQGRSSVASSCLWPMLFSASP
jgi:hypothetical protein